MKAISLWQPWASAMAFGLKHNETRSWPTAYRGDLVICSAKRKPTSMEVGELEAYVRILHPMPYGCALCVVELYDCLPTVLLDQPKLSKAEYELGNYEPGRFAWLTRNCRKFRSPIQIRGYQGIWNLDEKTEAEIIAMPKWRPTGDTFIEPRCDGEGEL